MVLSKSIQNSLKIKIHRIKDAWKGSQIKYNITNNKAGFKYNMMDLQAAMKLKKFNGNKKKIWNLIIVL